MTARARVAIFAALVAGAAAAAGCGQQSPLTLPGDGRPIESIDPQETTDEPQQTDEEQQDER